MITNLKPYSAYKDAGVEWFGQVPAHWEVRRIKHIARLNPSKSEIAFTLRDDRATFLPIERVGTDGSYDATEVRPILEVWNGFTYFRRGDVIVGKITPSLKTVKALALMIYRQPMVLDRLNFSSFARRNGLCRLIFIDLQHFQNSEGLVPT